MTKKSAQIVVVDDDAGVLQTAKFVLKQYYSKIHTTTNPRELPFLLGELEPVLVLLDMNFQPGENSGEEGLHWLSEIKERSPATSVVMITAYGELDLAVEAMKLGATDFIVKPWENEKFEATIQSAIELGESKKEIKNLKSIARPPSSGTTMIGDSPPIQRIHSMIEKVAPTDATVLITGENGTGKELVAQRIHEQSHRNEEPFIKVDLGSLSANLFESELFGHEKGAFTDAKEKKIGRFELANKGTLFLDEIGNIEPALQAKLLSVLQNREIFRLGSGHPIPIDIRLICATNLDLPLQVSEGEFREDLMYRLNTFEINLPPLRERKTDIPALSDFFLDRLSKRYHKGGLKLAPDTMKKLKAWNWPGNIRELEHTLERAAIMCEHSIIEAHDLNLVGHVQRAVAEDVNIKSLEKLAIQKAIQKHAGNMSAVAKDLGLGRTTLYRKMKKYDL